jgi:hypothetical protein
MDVQRVNEVWGFDLVVNHQQLGIWDNWAATLDTTFYLAQFHSISNFINKQVHSANSVLADRLDW